MNNVKTKSKSTDFRIEFDRRDATYAPGETVTGRVILIFSKPTDLRELVLEACGVAKVRWTEKRNRHRHEYKNEEHYFSISNRLAGNEGGYGIIKLPAGQNFYEFEFSLPTNIPSSFEHGDGFIRYTVKAILDRPTQSHCKIVSPITIVVPCDLKALKVGIRDQFERKFLSDFLCSAGKMEVDVKGQKSAFVPGETIELMVNIDNRSQVNIEQIQLKLMRNLTFIGPDQIIGPKRKQCSEALNNITMNKPIAKQSDLLLNFDVPPLSQPNLEYCSIIDVYYRLVLIIHLPGMYSPIKRMYPVELYDTVS